MRRLPPSGSSASTRHPEPDDGVLALGEVGQREALPARERGRSPLVVEGDVVLGDLLQAGRRAEADDAVGVGEQERELLAALGRGGTRPRPPRRPGPRRRPAPPRRSGAGDALPDDDRHGVGGAVGDALLGHREDLLARGALVDRVGVAVVRERDEAGVEHDEDLEDQEEQQARVQVLGRRPLAGVDVVRHDQGQREEHEEAPVAGTEGHEDREHAEGVEHRHEGGLERGGR